MAKVAYKKKRVMRKRIIKKVRIPKTLKNYVNKTIRKNEETKMVSNQYTLANFNSAVSVQADLITLLPQVQVGVNQDNRIGNSIRPVKMVITGYVVYNTSALAANQDARLIGARLFCFQDKTTRSYANNIYNYNLLNLGGTSTTFTGTPLNWCSPHNSDGYIWFADKKMRILKPFGYTNNSSPAPSATNAITGVDSSLFHPFRIVLTQKQLPAVFKYDQGDSLVYPTNFAPYIALGYSDLLNNSPDTTSTQLSMTFNCTLYFKDA
ncbi:hypothetical protein [Shewanella sp.]|uniref:hypothetical protein n=1 Tax=Shewanella sp. TaxID=50422 RepID=UPI0040479ACE